MIKRAFTAITYEKFERGAFAKTEVIDRDTSLPSAGMGQYGLACWIYLAASAVATLGWIWFLARISLQLLRIAWGFLENL